jgi:hypothetical protein
LQNADQLPPWCRIKAKQDKEAGIAAQQAEKDKKTKKKK